MTPNIDIRTVYQLDKLGHRKHKSHHGRGPARLQTAIAQSSGDQLQPRVIPTGKVWMALEQVGHYRCPACSQSTPTLVRVPATASHLWVCADCARTERKR